MAVTPKPKTAKAATVDIEALISKGGGTPGEQIDKEKDGTTAIVLRLPANMLDQVDAVVKARAVRIPRHTWILEAVHEKLLRETDK
ncbi:MAG: hypothetical protein Q8Q12_07425 [bacterium]|nr:hypothetical protein [bacterium]